MGPVREPESVLARMGYWCFETFTPIVEGSYTAARAAVDVALTGADLLLAGEPIVYGLCRPPGHHVGPRIFGGSSYLNNAAIAAESIARRTGEPVAVLDLDYHHGNGTQQLFYERPDVLYVSLHGDPVRAWPYFSGHADETGAGAGRGSHEELPAPRRMLRRAVPRGARARRWRLSLGTGRRAWSSRSASTRTGSTARISNSRTRRSTRSVDVSPREVAPPSCCRRVATTCRISAATRCNGSAVPGPSVRARRGRALSRVRQADGPCPVPQEEGGDAIDRRRCGPPRLC